MSDSERVLPTYFSASGKRLFVLVTGHDFFVRGAEEHISQHRDSAVAATRVNAVFAEAVVKSVRLYDGGRQAVCLSHMTEFIPTSFGTQSKLRIAAPFFSAFVRQSANVYAANAKDVSVSAMTPIPSARTNTSASPTPRTIPTAMSTSSNTAAAPVTMRPSF